MRRPSSGITGPTTAGESASGWPNFMAADNLATLRLLPQMRAHELTGDLAGKIPVDVKHPYRLLLVPDHDEVPRKADGGLDWASVTKIKILGIMDPD